MPLVNAKKWLMETADCVEAAKVPLVSLVDGPLVVSRDLLLDLARLTPRGTLSLVRRNWNLLDSVTSSRARYEWHRREDSWLYRDPRSWMSFPEPEKFVSFSFLTFTGADFASIAREVEVPKDPVSWGRAAFQRKLEPVLLINGSCESRFFTP